LVGVVPKNLGGEGRKLSKGKKKTRERGAQKSTTEKSLGALDGVPHSKNSGSVGLGTVPIKRPRCP